MPGWPRRPEFHDHRRKDLEVKKMGCTCGAGVIESANLQAADLPDAVCFELLFK